MVSDFPLPKRAVHIHFLRRLAQEKVPGGSERLGDLTTAQVVQLFIRPATLQGRSSLAECMAAGQVAPKYALPWTSAGTMRDVDGNVQQIFGQARYFASHAWSYKFGALVSMLDTHYSQLPGTKGGGRFQPVYYWVDILAVTQHFTGDFKDHPDSDFPSVIKSSKAVLFTMHPWRSPIAPTRVWCLFEALTAIQAPGVEFEVIVDVKDSKDTRVQTVQVISNSIDVRTAQATVSSDKSYILGCIDQGIGVNQFNNTIRKRLKEALLQAVTPNAVEMGDTAALHELLKVGGCVRPDGISDFPATFRFATETDLLNIFRTISLRDLRPRGLCLSGRVRTKEVTLADAGLRGWDGESFTLREYTETETGRVQWGYLPASPAVVQAIAEMLVMPTGQQLASITGSFTAGLGSGKGIEELWICLRAPKPEDFAKAGTFGGVAGTGTSGTGSQPGSPTHGAVGSPTQGGVGSPTAAAGSGSPSGMGMPPRAPSAGRVTSAGRVMGRSSTISTPGLPPPGSATAARAAQRAMVPLSPSRRRPPSSIIVANSGGSPRSSSSGLPSPGAAGSPAGPRPGSSLLSPMRRPPGSLSGLAPREGRESPSSTSTGLHEESSTASFSGLHAAALERLGLAPPEQRVQLPAGRPALWVAVGSSRTLRMLCLHCCVLGPHDVTMLTNALSTSRLEVLQAVKCSAPPGEANPALASMRLNAHLLVVALESPSLKQIHVRPSELAYVESFPQCTPPSYSQLRRVSFTPVALSPTAVRQLGRMVCGQASLHSLIVGMDPAPNATWMPKEQYDREHWVLHEERNEPDMAAKRKKYCGLDDEGQAAYIGRAWDMKDDLAVLPDPDRGAAAVQQRAAAISFYLCLSAGWRDMGTHQRQYARWAWQRKTSSAQLDEMMADLKKSLDAYRKLAFEMLRAAPESWAARFDPAEQKKRTPKSRLQTTFWDVYAAALQQPGPAQQPAQ
ncbi:hypothetical protein HYH03_009317 [Edaphochlamys debaryana]|uniref:Uncharacterized protein n=1 Tax=Edaphochlamys debaryana TaxID=47281 RepID=A0A836BYL6_9CHLO|nr:hypothetical protein HYH03_009317 [Edaphochlamys debaryana]|eukprot:KAG2492369.1 hypothetical protein HYH03_009317 [Edaphochlamys debaryana]